MSFFFIAFMLRMKKTIVTGMIHAMLMSSDVSKFPNIKPLFKRTTFVRGRKIVAGSCAA